MITVSNAPLCKRANEKLSQRLVHLYGYFRHTVYRYQVDIGGIQTIDDLQRQSCWCAAIRIECCPRVR